MRNKFWVVALLFLVPVAYALPLEEPLPNPAQEEKAQQLFHALRCVVCQSESIADSPADVAADMRREVRAQITAGKKRDDILSYFVQRYGEVVLMSPPFSPQTKILWLGTLLIIATATVSVILYFRRRA